MNAEIGMTVQLNHGRGLGRSSILSAEVFAPPMQGIIDSWASLGNDGWNWDSLRGFYDKSYTYPSISKSSWETLGFGSRAADDPWFNGSVGAFINLASVDPTSREKSKAANCYCDPIKHRKNIYVLCNATLKKILFKEGSTKAIRLQYHHDSIAKSVTARKEVIIAAGALQSPKILELSGIGNRDILVQHGIDAIKDLPGVGEGLKDHLVVDLGFEAEALETRDSIIRREPDAVRWAIAEYTADRTGILTSSGILTYAYMPVDTFPSHDGHQRLRTLLEENRPKKGDLEGRELARALAFYGVAEKALLGPTMPSGVYISSLGQNPLESDPVTGQRTFKPLPGKHLVSNPVNIEIFAEHMLYLESLASSSPLSGLLKRPPKPPRSISHLADLEGAKEYIRTRATSMVHGVENLRVVDSSIIPVLPPGNFQSTLYADTERAAWLIKSEYRLKCGNV
ncbi:oxidoreductase [Hypoxylon crocopeplum]|nr:oxidoreductase [Hypoxylon crocopeplum]